MSRHHQAIKNDPRWKAVREECLERDGYRCQDCGVTAEELEDQGAPLWDRLQVDHIEELATAPELAFELDNLRTLCGPCNRERNALGNSGIKRMHWISDKYRHAMPESIL
jgi:5-methylcytosine-specific restriction protein A